MPSLTNSQKRRVQLNWKKTKISSLDIVLAKMKSAFDATLDMWLVHLRELKLIPNYLFISRLGARTSIEEYMGIGRKRFTSLRQWGCCLRAPRGP